MNKQVVFHVREFEKPGAITLVFERTDTPDVWRAGVSICSTKDQFNRKLGLAIARGRLEKKSSDLFVGSPEGIIRAVISVMTRIYHRKHHLRFNVALARLPKSKFFKETEDLDLGELEGAITDNLQKAGLGGVKFAVDKETA